MAGSSYGDSSYTWKPGDKTIIRVSKSTLGAVDWCLQQLWLDKTLPVQRASTEPMTVGNDVHYALERFYMHCEEDNDNIEVASEAMLKGETKKAYNAIEPLFPSAHQMKENAWRDPRDMKQPFYTAPYAKNREWLIRHEMERLRYTAPEDFSPLGNELRVEARATYNVPEFGEIEVQFVGIIDRIFDDGDGGLALMELKTGKWHPRKRSDMRREMAYYKFLLEIADPNDLPDNIRGKTVTHWGWRFPKADHWHYEKTKGVSEKAMHRRLVKLLTAYLTEEFTPCVTLNEREDFKCGWCDFQQYCPLYTPFDMEAVS